MMCHLPCQRYDPVGRLDLDSAGAAITPLQKRAGREVLELRMLVVWVFKGNDANGGR